VCVRVWTWNSFKANVCVLVEDGVELVRLVQDIGTMEFRIDYRERHESEQFQAMNGNSGLVCDVGVSSVFVRVFL